jgi:hypothetical protein
VKKTYKPFIFLNLQKDEGNYPVMLFAEMHLEEEINKKS